MQSTVTMELKSTGYVTESITHEDRVLKLDIVIATEFTSWQQWCLSKFA